MAAGDRSDPLKDPDQRFRFKLFGGVIVARLFADSSLSMRARCNPCIRIPYDVSGDSCANLKRSGESLGDDVISATFCAACNASSCRDAIAARSLGVA